MKHNKNILQNEAFECQANVQGMLKLAKTAVGITLMDRPFYRNSVTMLWILVSNSKKKESSNYLFFCVLVCVCSVFSPCQVRCWMSNHDRCPTYDSFWRRKLFSEAQLFSFFLSTCQEAEWAALHSLCTSAMNSLFFFHYFSDTSSASRLTYNHTFHPLLLDNLASAHLDTWT